MQFKSIPFKVTITYKDTSQSVARQLQTIIDTQAQGGWEFLKIETFETVVLPSVGCFGIGAEHGFTTYFPIIVFQKSANVDFDNQDDILEIDNIKPSQPISTSETFFSGSELSDKSKDLELDKKFQETRVVVQDKIYLLSNRIKNNPKVAIIVGAAFITLFTIYQIFIKNHPDKDAKEVATMYCNCVEQNNERLIQANQSFIQSFTAFGFKSRYDARMKLQEILATVLESNSNCEKMTKEKFNEFGKRYDNKEWSEYKETYDRQTNSYNATNVTNLTIANASVENKILEITDPEPDIEKIKSDLIGQSIADWTFNFLSEYKNVVIIDTVRSNGRTEYHINFHLIGETDKQEHNCEVIVVYSYYQTGWTFSNVSLLSITNKVLVQLDQWSKLNIPQGCKLEIIDSGHKYWLSENTFWSSKYKGGGEDGESYNNITNNSLLISSREENAPVELIFKFTPITQAIR